MDDTLPASGEPAHGSPLTAGAVIGSRYRIVRYLARGGMGEVYEAVDALLGTRVALKFIHGRLAADPGIREALRSEVRLAQSVTHECVARTFTLEHVDDQLFVVMELLEGQTVAQRLARGPLPVEEALRIAAAVLDGLAAAHDRGVVHRDVKPGNVVLCYDGRLVLMDFGVARRKLAGQSDGSADAGVLVGTPGYIAPEVIGGQPATVAADLYAVGVMTFEMLSGRPLFDADSSVALMSKHVDEPVPQPLAELCRVPAFVAETIAQLLAKQPEDRPPSARAARSGLIHARPRTCYATNGPYHLAYQLLGSGPIDVVHLPGWVSHLEEQWEHAEVARWLRRLASSCRLVLTDRRGLGMSDPAPAMPTLAERVDDLIAVLDAAQVARAVVFGISEGGPTAVQFAATHPERTRALILCNTFPRITQAPDFPWGATEESGQEFIKTTVERWGSGGSTQALAPSRKRDADFVARMGRLERAGATPGQARAIFSEVLRLDVRHLLPQVQVPVLILHRREDKVAVVEGARYMAEQLPNARLVELSGRDHLFCIGNTDEMVTEIEKFLSELT